jgi:hypothetical protein
MLVLPKQTKNYDPEDAADILPTNACMVKANNIKDTETQFYGLITEI